MLSNTLLLQHLTPACVLILSMTAKGLCPSKELLSIQGISNLQTEDWRLFFFFLSSLWQSKTWIEPFSCLLVSKLVHCLARQLGRIGWIPNKYFISSLSRGGEMGLSEMSGLWGFLLAVPTLYGRGGTCHSLWSSILKPKPLRTPVP